MKLLGLRSAFLAAFVLATGLAQDTTGNSTSSSSSSSADEAAVELPACALQCIASAFQLGLCEPTDAACRCTNEEFQAETSHCVLEACTVKQALFVKNVTATACGEPVRDLSQAYADIGVIMGVVSGVVVLLRIGYKLYEFKSLASDDWFCLATIISGVPSSIITVHGTTANGLGKDAWTLPPENLTNFGMFFYIMAVLYFLQVTLLKMTLLFFYLRIFPAQNVRRLLWGTVVFNGLVGVVYVVMTALQCRPVSYFWTKWDGEHEGTCLSIGGVTWSNAIISIALDLWMLAIPLWQLRTMNLHWKKKVGVAMMFTVGTFVTVVSVLRLRTLVSFTLSDNPTWLAYDVSLWSTIEINVGIMCTCMPTLRLLIVKVVPALGWSTIGRSRYGTGGYAGSKSNGGKLQSSSGNHLDSRSKRGITLQKSYDVQYSDEASLVHMQDLETQRKTPNVSKSEIVSSGADSPTRL